MCIRDRYTPTGWQLSVCLCWWCLSETQLGWRNSKRFYPCCYWSQQRWLPWDYWCSWRSVSYTHLGLGDCCFGISALILLWKRIYRKQGIGLEKKDWFLYGFLSCIIIINGMYWFLIKHPDSIKHTIYWIYAIMIVWSFRQLGSRNILVQALMKTLKISILFQTVVWSFGWGRIYYEYWGATRYMGTFNNPNQMAYIIFLMLLLLYFYELDKKKFWLFGIMAGMLIAATKSTGVFLGWCTRCV